MGDVLWNDDMASRFLILIDVGVDQVVDFPRVLIAWILWSRLTTYWAWNMGLDSFSIRLWLIIINDSCTSIMILISFSLKSFSCVRCCSTLINKKFLNDVAFRFSSSDRAYHLLCYTKKSSPFNPENSHSWV